MATFISMNASKIIKEQKNAAMRSLMFLTKKQDGMIKLCACADGSVKRRQPGYRLSSSLGPLRPMNAG